MASGEFSDEDYDDLPLINIFDARVDEIVKEAQEINKKVIDDILKEKEEREKARREKSNNPYDVIDPKSLKSIAEHAEEKKATKQKIKTDKVKNKRKGASPPKAEKLLKLSAKAKKRLKILEMETAHDSRRVEKMNQFVFDQMDALEAKEKAKKVEVLELSNRDMFLKIRYRSKIHRLQVKFREKFQYIFPKVAHMVGLKTTSILLCLDERNIQLSDTPESLDIKVLDVIDCLPFEETPEKGGYNMMLLKFQSNDFRRRNEFYVHKLEKFSEIKKKYVALRKLNINAVSFKFDDEPIDLDDNPLDLEMESGYVIDVTVKLKEKASSTITRDTEGSSQEITPRITPLLTVIDSD